MGQTRGAQSGEADRHAVWLAAQNLEPKLSPFDPFAILDEIQRLVPGYQASRLELLAGNDVHVQPSLVQIDAGPERHALVLPAQDTLFTSGTLGPIQHSSAFGHGVAHHQTNGNGRGLRKARESKGTRELPDLFLTQLFEDCRSAGHFPWGRSLHRAAGAQARRAHPKPLGTYPCGPFGLWQPMADGLKLFLKEDLMPTNVYRPLYILAPMIALCLRFDLDCRSALRCAHHLARRRHVRDRQRQHRAAGHPRRHFRRCVRDRARRLVLQ